MGKDKTNGPIHNPGGLGKWFNGMKRSEIVCHQGDGNPKGGSFLNVPSNMKEDNPFKSNKQRKFLFSQKPDVAKKFAMHKGKV